MPTQTIRGIIDNIFGLLMDPEPADPLDRFVADNNVVLNLEISQLLCGHEMMKGSLCTVDREIFAVKNFSPVA